VSDEGNSLNTGKQDTAEEEELSVFESFNGKFKRNFNNEEQWSER